MTQPKSNKTRNVVFIGEAGSGKSSLINLIAAHDIAWVSPGTMLGTVKPTSYEVPDEERNKMYRLWDTPGFNQSSGRTLFGQSTTTTGSLKKFLRERLRRGELDLLVVCHRGSRANVAVSRLYDIFCRATRLVGIPVVIAITHLERAQPTMEGWWLSHGERMKELGLEFDGHACLTCLPNNPRTLVSRQNIRALISGEFTALPSPILPGQEYLNDTGCVVC